MIFSMISKLQGKDRWPSAIATVSDVTVVSEGGRNPGVNKITFTYRDQHQELQSSSLKADSTTSLFNIQAKDEFEIRYNPKNPSRTYTDEADSVFSDFRAGFWLCAAAFALVAIIVTLLKKL